MTEPTWTRRAVKIVLGPEDGPADFTLSGWVCDDVPGLAVNPTVRAGKIAAVTPGRGWSITHVASGREIAAGMTEVVARRRAVKLEPLANWGASMAELVAREHLFAEVQHVVDGGRWGGLVPKRLRRSRAEEVERKARGYLAEALRIHENRADDANASRIRAALTHLDK